MKSKCQKQWLPLVLTAGLLLTPLSPVLAAEDGGISFDLDQVVVTATRTEKKLRDVPAAVEVITKEEMEKRNIKRVADALKIVPGVYVRQTKGLMGSTDSITMRGFGSQKQVLILMDGQPLNDAYSGSVNLANIPTENIQQIEVIKGPTSALYGSNAMGGVINIITKEKSKRETILRLGTGELSMEVKSLYHSGNIGKLDYFLTVQSTKADGYETAEEYKTGKAGSDRAKNPGKNGMKRDLYDAKIVYHLDDKSKLSLAGGSNIFSYFSENVADRGTRDEDLLAIGYENKLTEQSSLKLNYNEKKLYTWYVTTSYSSTTNNISSYNYTTTPSRVKQMEFQYNQQLGSKDLLILGYAYKTEQADSRSKTLTAASKGWDLSMTNPTADSDIGGKTATKSFYLQDEHKLNEQTTLYIGGRYDDWRFHDGYTYAYEPTKSQYLTKKTPESKANSFNPKLGLVYKANEKLTIRSSLGKAFRAPNVYELAKDWESSSSSTIYKCNPDLQPEKSTNYEIGFDYQVDKSLLTRINLYQSDVTEIIDKKNTLDSSTGKTISQFINSGKARIKGIEVGVDKRWNSSWTSSLNYTYTDAKVTESLAAPENINKQMSTVPKEMVNLLLNYDKGSWQGSLTGNWVSESNAPDKQGKRGYGTYEPYFTVDMKLSYKMDPDTTVSLSIDNLFNKEYYVYYLAQPRTTYLELTKKF